MSNKIATVVLALLMSAGLLASPASAAEIGAVEPDPAPSACGNTYDGTDLEMALTNEVKSLRVNLTVVESTLTVLRAQRDLEAERADKLQTKVTSKQATIDRLRAALRRR